MDFTVKAISLCGGGGHVIFDCATPDGPRVIAMDWDELLNSDSIPHDLIMLRIRSAVREGIIGKNVLELKLSLEGKTFKT